MGILLVLPSRFVQACEWFELENKGIRYTNCLGQWKYHYRSPFDFIWNNNNFNNFARAMFIMRCRSQVPDRGGGLGVGPTPPHRKNPLLRHQKPQKTDWFTENNQARKLQSCQFRNMECTQPFFMQVH